MGRESTLTLLVNPDWRDLPKHGRFRTSVPYFPLELLYIEAGLKARGLPVKLADLWGGTVPREEYTRLAAEAAYIVVTTAPTYIFWRAGVCDVEFPKQFLTTLRELAAQATIIVIGPQGTALPHTMADAPFDYLLRGEADMAVPELVETLSVGGDPSGIAGVCHRRNGQLCVTETEAVVKDLNALPLMDLASLVAGEYGQVCYEASRGCPYDCTFCFRSGFRESFRLKKTERIREELERYVAAGYNHVAMIDEIFGMGPKWLEQFCDAIQPLNLYWGIQTRTECLSPERLERLQAAGCISIEIGLESADPVVSEAMGKHTDYEHLSGNIRRACELGFEQVRLFCIFGAPCETRESIQNTEKYLLQFAEFPAVHADVFAHMPLPGTPVWKSARDKGYPLNNWNDVKRFTGCIENAFHSPEEVEEIIAEFDEKWMRIRKRFKLYRDLSGRLVPIRDLIPEKLRQQIRAAIQSTE